MSIQTKYTEFTRRAQMAAQLSNRTTEFKWQAISFTSFDLKLLENHRLKLEIRSSASTIQAHGKTKGRRNDFFYFHNKLVSNQTGKNLLDEPTLLS